MTKWCHFALTDDEVKRYKHASELCAVADELDFAMLMFVVGEFESLLEECGLVADEDEDAVLV